MSYSIQELDTLIKYYKDKGFNSSALENLKAKIIDKKNKKSSSSLDTGLVIPKELEHILKKEDLESEEE